MKSNIRGNWCAINAWPPLSESGEHDVQQWNRCMRSISILESVGGDEVGQWRELDKLNKQRRC